MTYLADVVTLTRKDLKIELRARDTLPAMLLFVLSTLVVFHFALPEGAGDGAAYGLLWVAVVFTALLGLARAWVPEHEHGLPTLPQVKNLGGGRYLIEGLKFHMPGSWIVALRIKSGGVTDSVRFELAL